MLVHKSNTEHLKIRQLLCTYCISLIKLTIQCTPEIFCYSFSPKSDSGDGVNVIQQKTEDIYKLKGGLQSIKKRQLFSLLFMNNKK